MQMSNYELIGRAANAYGKRSNGGVCIDLDQSTVRWDPDPENGPMATILLYNSGWPFARYRWNGRRLRQRPLRGDE
jgi:hypothetical protein